MARGRPKGSRNRKAQSPAAEALAQVGPEIEAQAAAAMPDADLPLPPRPPPAPSLDGLVYDAKGQQLRFDAAARARIQECAEVYLVCKNGAQDKSVHPCLWLKEVV